MCSPLLDPPPLPKHSLSSCPTPPLCIKDDYLEASQKLSHEREFQMIVEKSLLPENRSCQLRSASERRRPLSFDEMQYMREGAIGEKKRSQQKRDGVEESEVQKREKKLIEVLKCKMWESLVVKARYPKRTTISVDILDYEDALLWSHLFDKEEAFRLFYLLPSSASSSSSSGLSHHQKKCVWKTSILSPSQVGDWLQSITKCFQDTHCVEVMFHTGVIQSNPTPLEVSFYFHECTSWKSASIFGEGGEFTSVVTTSRFSLDVSFRISCSNCQYQE
jgi:hypothetical protein